MPNTDSVKRKGIVLAGGSGTRLHPITLGVSKQLVPIFSKPMIYYPISVLMLAGIRDILIITTPHDQASFQRLLGDGSQFGVHFSYEVQSSPDGLAQAFLIGEEFIADHHSALVLGDNIFYGQNLTGLVREASNRQSGSTVFAYQVDNPSAYGVVDFDETGKAIHLEEKPSQPRSKYAVTGLYFYDQTVVDKAHRLKPSSRGELEITDLNRMYLEEGDMHVVKFGRGFAWLDTGTAESMLQASNFVQAVEERQGLMVACLEEIAFRMGWISREQLIELAKPMLKNQYGQYLQRLAESQGDSL
ncbi:glucose-1-phosphate thymidylyltransferase RfbA [Kamptonema cortianum]|nr:glucose-1-phosphate thymidylyltransferase RfbA [Geitlerinema splendidum]MDK3160383.1 glucose-1-phosphate thymidylyltransferase RfbA [Kamptonema cortianum]